MRYAQTLVFIALLLATTAHGATLTLVPDSIYEASTDWFNITINNYQGATEIKDIKVTGTFTFLDAQEYDGWNTFVDSGFARWTDGSIGTNVVDALFEFQIGTPNITADEARTITISLDGQDTVFNISLLNDPTPPTITSITPNQYAKANSHNHTITITAEDQETGVTSATYAYNDCANGDTIVSLSRNNDTFTGTANFSTYSEGDTACYTVTAKNRAGEQTSTTGTLQFDGTPPTVELLAPDTYVTEQSTVTFNATDNIATELACTLKLNGTTVRTLNATSGQLTSTTLNLTNQSEGDYTATIECQDGVGLQASHSKSLILDTNAPALTGTLPASIPRNTDVAITFNATDTIGLSTVTATWQGSNLSLTSNGNEYTATISASTLGTGELQITATDNAKHTTTLNKTITIVPNHQLTLTLSQTSTTPGSSITASGALQGDGSYDNDTVTLNLPGGDVTADLSNDQYSQPFTAPNAGTYTITATYYESGHAYTATATLTTQSAPSQGGSIGTSSGPGFDSWRYSGYVKPDEDSDGDNQEDTTSDTENVEEQEEPEEYQPLDPQDERTGLAPQATGVFSLGDAIKWGAILLVLGGLAGLGVYAYRKPKKKEGIDWDNYFK